MSTAEPIPTSPTTRVVEVALSIMKPIDARQATIVRLHVQDATVSEDYVIVDLTAEQFTRLVGGTIITTPGDVFPGPYDWETDTP